jgi:SAM-dependent methyltransferase
MPDLQKEYLISFYDKLVGLFGATPDALGWSRSGQAARYGALLETMNLAEGGLTEASSVLDFGCGMADFYGYLEKKGIEVNYTGFDINPTLMGIARERYPECRFGVFDIEGDELTENFDFIIMCGVFNQRLEGVEDSARDAIRRLWPHAKNALVFNALSAAARRKDPALQYYHPEDMLHFTRTLSNEALLREDLVPGDIFLCLYR